MTAPKYQRAAGILRDQITAGTLAPGAPAPSGATLARMTGYSALTCRRALTILVKDGTLVPGASRHARPRVPSGSRDDLTLADAKRALSQALADRRHAAGLTQSQLAKLIGLSVTTIGHAETGRTWQSRPFWELADKALNAGGELLRLHDNHRAAKVPTEENAETEDNPPETNPTKSMASVMVNVPGPVTCITITWIGGAVTNVYPSAEAMGQE